MPEVTETHLPGVGVRHDFTTATGQRLGVIAHRGGRREVLVYDTDDPDACRTVMQLDVDDARTLAEVLGASRVSEAVAAVQQRIEGLSIDWITVPDGSAFVGRTIADGEIRTRTGVSIVAVIRGADTTPAPPPTFGFAAGDVAVAVGTPAGLDAVRAMLAP
ncbi:MAG: cation:proton antiporter regulatory subunit [Acidimicrobiales bacterium]